MHITLVPHGNMANECEGDTWKPCVNKMENEKKKRILPNGKCDQFVEENKTKKKKQFVEGRREKRKKKEKEKKGKEEEEKERRTDCSPSIFWRLADQGVGIVHASRGRGSLLL